MSLSKQILDVMEQNPKFKYNCRAMYQALFYQHGGKVDQKLLAQVRTTLNRLHKNGKIRKVKRGRYQIKFAPKIIKKLEDPATKVHGLKIEYQFAENNILKIHGISAHSNILSFLRSNGFEEVRNGSGRSLRRFSKYVWWEDRKITFTIHNCGLLEIYCGASKNCMSFSDFVRFNDFLKGFLNPICEFEKSKAIVKQIALNRDFEELEMSGVSCITLKKFENDWCRIYQKDDIVRFEHHLKLEITLEDTFNSLQLLTYAPQLNGNNKPVEDMYV